MTLKEILWGSGGVIIILLTLIQITPIRVNPWTAIIKAIGRAFNTDVIKDLKDIKTSLLETQERLEGHILADDMRAADEHRRQILRFNGEVLRKLRHTKEEFDDVLVEIDEYERYCKAHPDYKNNRAVLAIENLRRVYKILLETNDFLT